MKTLRQIAGRTRLPVAVVLIAATLALTLHLERRKPKSVLAAESSHSDASKPMVGFDEDGRLLRPEGYRKWIYVGSPVTPNDLNHGQAAFPEFHSVYIDPESFEHFENAGKFRDGAVVVKELISVGAKKASSGQGYFMGEFTGLEVAIKDAKRFPNAPGNWAYFSFGHEYPLADRAGSQPLANCSACHGSLAADDYVFTQYYPILRAAKKENRSR